MSDVSVVFTKEMDRAYNELEEKAKQDKEAGTRKSFNIQLLKAVDRTVDTLKWNPQHGKHIPKRNIPKIQLDKYGVNDLWKVNLPRDWRLLYTITRGELKIICLLLEMCDHNEYNKMFQYRKK